MHVEAMWELEARLNEEKRAVVQQCEALASQLAQARADKAETLASQQDLAAKLTRLLTEHDAILRFFPAQVPPLAAPPRSSEVTERYGLGSFPRRWT